MHAIVSAVNLIYICIHSPSDPVAFWNWSATYLVGSVKATTYRKFALKTQMATELQHTLKKGRKYDKYCICCDINDFTKPTPFNDEMLHFLSLGVCYRTLNKQTCYRRLKYTLGVKKLSRKKFLIIRSYRLHSPSIMKNKWGEMLWHPPNCLFCNEERRLPTLCLLVQLRGSSFPDVLAEKNLKHILNVEQNHAGALFAVCACVTRHHNDRLRSSRSLH